MRGTKKLLAAFAAVTMVLNMPVLTSAENVSVSQDDTTETIKDYLDFCIPRYMAIHGIEMNATISYSNLIPLYDFNSFSFMGYETFVIDDGELIGKVDVYVNDELGSMFDTNITKEMQEAFDSNGALAIGYYDDSLLTYTLENGYSLADGLYTGYPTETPEVYSISSSNIMLSSKPVEYSWLGSRRLDIEHVPNSTVEHADGECWAASAAMVLNYKLGTSLTADIIYRKMTEIGKSHHTPSAYDYYGYTPYTIQKDITPECGAMSADAVWDQLDNDRPVVITVKEIGADKSHVVVIHGIYIDSSYTTYTIDNPNTEKEQSFTIKGNPNTITESIAYGHYNKWCQSIY